MSITNALNNAISGLATTSRRAEVVSSNLSNALTEGYARREVDTVSVNIGGNGAGVRIAGIRREVDLGLLANRRNADARFGASEYRAQSLARIQELMGAPGDASGLAARLARVEEALLDASANPASDLRLGTVTTRLGELVEGFQSATTAIQTSRQEADRNIANGIETLNTSLRRVQVLNNDIKKALVSGLDGTALMDARQRVVDTIAELVPVRQQQRPGGQIVLYSQSGATLIDGNAQQFEFSRTPTIVAEMSLASGGLSGISRDGVPLDPADGFGKLGGGLLEAAFIARDRTLVEAQAGIDTAAADLIVRYSDPAVDPTLPAGAPGLLTDRGAAFDPALVTGLAARISVNAAVDPAQGGGVFRIRDGMGAAVPGPIGNAEQINRLRAALGVGLTPFAGAPAQDAFSRLNDLSESWGAQRLRADEALTFDAARQQTLLEAERAQGVDSDVELQKLLQIEQAYAANTRLIQTVDEMIQRLMEI